MSGTSLDGIDIALVDFNNPPPKCRVFDCTEYPPALKRSLHQLNLTPEVPLHKLCELETELGQFYAHSVQQFLQANGLNAPEINAIGCHGQTIFHAPDVQMSLQIGHPAHIAKQTGITTVGDFRIDDMANGGQGAPLAPAFHHYLFQTNPKTAIVNIGGIANISFFNGEKSIGFDTGPGNGLMDEICQKHLNQNYDKNGSIAAHASPNKSLLKKLLADPYFQTTYPKSTGRDYFNYEWLHPFIENESTEVIIATLNLLTATTIANDINKLGAENIVICGGGAENQTLLNHLGALTNATVNTSQALGYNPHSIEAMMMAWLAKQRLDQQPIKLHQTTGASKDSVLGAVWHP